MLKIVAGGALTALVLLAGVSSSATDSSKTRALHGVVPVATDISAGYRTYRVYRPAYYPYRRARYVPSYYGAPYYSSYGYGPYYSYASYYPRPDYRPLYRPFAPFGHPFGLGFGVGFGW